jgi:hypothetical protein
MGMSQAEQYQRLDRRNLSHPASEDVPTDYVQVYVPEEDDDVNWPPVIARVRDLDKALAPEHHVNSAPPETKRHSKSVRVPATKSPRSNEKIATRLIALAGLFILIVAIVPFKRLLDSKTESDAVNPSLEMSSPAPNAGLAPSWAGNTANTADAIAEASKPSRSNLPPPLTNNIKPSANMASSVPPLYPPAAKADSVDRWGNPILSANRVNNRTDAPAELIARRPPAIQEGAMPPARVPNNHNLQQPPNGAVEQETNPGEYSTWPNAFTPKADPPYADNGLLRGAPELPAILPGSAPNGFDSTPAIQNKTMVSGGANPQGIENPPRTAANVPPLYYAPRPTTLDSNNENRNVYQDNRNVYQDNRNVYQDNRNAYQADARAADYRRPYDFTPDYRMNSAPTGQNPPNGQNPPLYRQTLAPYSQNPSPYGQNQSPYGQNPSPYGQNPYPYGQNPPPVGRGGAMQQQTPIYNPNQPAPQGYPSNRPGSANPMPNPAAGAVPYDTYPATSANNTTPSTGNSDGFSYPVTENPPARKPYERPRPSIY